MNQEKLKAYIKLLKTTRNQVEEKLNKQEQYIRDLEKQRREKRITMTSYKYNLEIAKQVDYGYIVKSNILFEVIKNLEDIIK